MGATVHAGGLQGAQGQAEVWQLDRSRTAWAGGR